jgi:dipeptidyl-peptidase-4
MILAWQAPREVEGCIPMPRLSAEVYRSNGVRCTCRWYSQRSDWGNLYLYDLSTGVLKNDVTTGEGPVEEILAVNEETRTLYYMANGREPGQDPYFAHCYSIHLDGKGEQVSLTPEDGTHSVQISPQCNYIIDTCSKAESPPVVTLRSAADSTLIMQLEETDISGLVGIMRTAPNPQLQASSQ